MYVSELQMQPMVILLNDNDFIIINEVYIDRYISFNKIFLKLVMICIYLNLYYFIIQGYIRLIVNNFLLYLWLWKSLMIAIININLYCFCLVKVIKIKYLRDEKYFLLLKTLFQQTRQSYNYFKLFTFYKVVKNLQIDESKQ